MSLNEKSFDAAYDEMLQFLFSLDKFGILLGLENISDLLRKIDNPQHLFKSVHVAGSNGKGSTCSFITGIIRASGFKPALYTSPHLNDFRERIRLNGALVSKQALMDAVNKVRPIYNPERTTFFELTTAAAFQCIADFKPDIAVIEVGLGGRLDATNTINPLVTIITDISREHEDYLGEGIRAVATEKAGIIKADTPLITGASRSEAREVILGIAKGKGAGVKQFAKDFSAKRTGLKAFDYTSEFGAVKNLELRMPGSHQIKNAALAIAVTEELRDYGFNITEEAIREAVSETVFPGRFEILGHDPEIIIDGAHTLEGMRLLKSTLRQFYPNRRILLLLGILADKDYFNLVNVIAPVAAEVVCVSPQGYRSLEPDQLAEVVQKCGVAVSSAPSIEDGFQILRNKATAEDVILAAGSLYMIGPVRRACGYEDR
jgi:dihydrofolate synthase / folylpolyglutamate synthase